MGVSVRLFLIRDSALLIFHWSAAHGAEQDHVWWRACLTGVARPPLQVHVLLDKFGLAIAAA